MMRYNPTGNNIGVRYDGKRFFMTTSYPTIALDPSDIYIVASAADYLDKLADQYYKDATLWWVIAQANAIKGSLAPTPGQQLRIPGNLSLILANFNTANS
jgi:LysM domain